VSLSAFIQSVMTAEAPAFCIAVIISHGVLVELSLTAPVICVCRKFWTPPKGAMAKAADPVPIISQTADHSPWRISQTTSHRTRPPVFRPTLVQGLLHRLLAIAKVQYHLLSSWMCSSWQFGILQSFHQPSFRPSALFSFFWLSLCAALYRSYLLWP
jgi:hypothetical protein